MSWAKNNLRALVDELYARSANRIVPPVTFAQVQAALGVATSAIGVNGQRIVDLGTPVNATDAATKQYVDAFSAGLSLKASVIALSSTPIALTGAQTIDGVSIVAGNRVLVAGQGGTTNTPAVANGIYVAAVGAWTRSADMPAGSAASAVYAFVSQGTSFGAEPG